MYMQECCSREDGAWWSGSCVFVFFVSLVRVKFTVAWEEKGAGLGMVSGDFRMGIFSILGWYS